MEAGGHSTCQARSPLAGLFARGRRYARGTPASAASCCTVSHAAAGGVRRSHLDLPHRHRTQDTGQPVDVVGVQVGEHDGSHRTHAQPVEAPAHRLRFRTRCRRPPRPRPGREDQAVALTDVAGHQHPAVGWPAERRHRLQDGDDHECRTAARRPTGAAAPTACRRRRPRTAASATASAGSDDPQPTSAPGSPAACVPTATIHQPGTTAAAPTTSATGSATTATTPATSPRTVAGPTAGATSTLAATATTDTRSDSAATTGVHTTCAASGTASASAAHRGSQRLQRVAPRWPQHEDRPGRERRQHEAGRARQPRVDQHQHQHRDAQRPQPAPAVTGRQARERDQAHRGRPQHARVGPGEEHEPDRTEHAHGAEHPAADAERAGDAEERRRAPG